MKYLKKFNESNSDSYRVDEIKKFCEENLAYLKDEGFLLSYRTNLSSDCIDILLYKHVGKGTFMWSEIVDDFIPFLQILDSEYELMKLKKTSNRDKYSQKCVIKINDYKGVYRYSLDDLVNDRTIGISDKKIDYIEFSIKK